MTPFLPFLFTHRSESLHRESPRVYGDRPRWMIVVVWRAFLSCKLLWSLSPFFQTNRGRKTRKQGRDHTCFACKCSAPFEIILNLKIRIDSESVRSGNILHARHCEQTHSSKTFGSFIRHSKLHQTSSIMSQDLYRMHLRKQASWKQNLDANARWAPTCPYQLQMELQPLEVGL